LLVVLSVVHLAPLLPLRRRLDEPRSQMMTIRNPIIQADGIMCWDDPPPLEIVTHPIVPRARNIL
jgi:hypothetical protein